MREIKFRAWTGDEMTRPCNLWNRGDSPVSWLNDLPYLDSVLMQYTGLKDKNGKEIYEGDIIVGDPYSHKPMIVFWDDKLCGFELKAVDESVYTHFIDYSGPNDYTEILWEVIGNIYENPELLEK